VRFTFGHTEAVNLGEVNEVDIAVNLDGLCGFLVPYVADALEEEKTRMWAFQSVRSTALPRRTRRNSRGAI